MRRSFLFFLLAAIPVMLWSCSSDDDCEGEGCKYVGENADVYNVRDFQIALDNGVQTIRLMSPLTQEARLVIPDVYDEGETLTMHIPAGNNNVSMTEQRGRGNRHFPALDLNITDANALTVTAPTSNVTFKGNAVTMSASTAPTSLIVAQNAHIGTLTLLQGRAYIYGRVDAFGDISNSSSVIWGAATAQQLTEVLARPATHNHGVILTADIAVNTTNGDLFAVGAPSTTTPPAASNYTGYVIDGGEHKITGAATNNILAIYANNVTINNLAIEQLENRPNDANGILFYNVTGGLLDNVQVRNAYKSGIVVSSSEVTARNILTENSGWQGVDITKGVDPVTTRRPVFVLENGNINDRVKIAVETNAVNDYDVRLPQGWISWQEAGKIIYDYEQIAYVLNQQAYNAFIANPDRHAPSAAQFFATRTFDGAAKTNVVQYTLNSTTAVADDFNSYQGYRFVVTNPERENHWFASTEIYVSAEMLTAAYMPYTMELWTNIGNGAYYPKISLHKAANAAPVWRVFRMQDMNGTNDRYEVVTAAQVIEGWNTVEISGEGDKITYWINGVGAGEVSTAGGLDYFLSTIILQGYNFAGGPAPVAGYNFVGYFANTKALLAR